MNDDLRPDPDAIAATKAGVNRPRSFGQFVDRLVRKYLWGMEIHKSAWIARSAYIDRTWPRGIRIGEGCVIDEEASVLTHDMTRGVYLNTHIGNGTKIGARAIIMPGLTIGEGCKIEPGSVVIRDLEAGSHVRGNPAKPVEPLTSKA